MQVQYINPLAAGVWNGFGATDKWKISMDNRQGDAYAKPGTTLDGGNGQLFWGKAGGGESSASSGWFIDAVEGFRPYKGKVHPSNYSNANASGWRQEPKDTSNLCWTQSGLDDMFDGGDYQWANAKGLNNYNQNSTNYLGTSGLEKMKSPGTTMQTISKNSGGQVAKTVNIGPNGGIDDTTGIIQISYAGIGDEETKTSKGITDWTLYTFQLTASKHATDVAFITKLTQPGTTWKWEEDPGQVIYRTVVNSGLTNSSTPTTQQWSREQSDFDGYKGVALWNYVTFSDYPIKPHHTYWYKWSCWGVGKEKPVHKTDWISRAISDSTSNCGAGCLCFPAWLAWDSVTRLYCSPTRHSTEGSNDWSGFWSNVWNGSWQPSHYHFPAGAQDWDRIKNKRRRFTFFAEAISALDDNGNPAKPGTAGPHYYS